MIEVRDVDNVVLRLERYWGVDRLPRLVSDFLRVKFASQCELWDAAIESGDPERIDNIGGGMIRAWEALDDDARRNGHRERKHTIWTAKHPGTGKVVGIYNGDVSLIELRDVADCGFPLADLVKFIPDILVNALEAFPGAEVGEVRKKEPFDDEIPF